MAWAEGGWHSSPSPLVFCRWACGSWTFSLLCQLARALQSIQDYKHLLARPEPVPGPVVLPALRQLLPTQRWPV